MKSNKIRSVLRGATAFMCAGMIASSAMNMVAKPVNAAALGDGIGVTISNGGFDPGYFEETDYEKIREFVGRLYNICLDRGEDQEGMIYWAGQLQMHEATGVSVAHGFVFSEEFQNKNCTNEEYVGYMYNAFFGREPADEEVSYWAGEMRKGMDRETVFSGFANSAEFDAICQSFGVIRGDFVPGLSVNQTLQINLFVQRLYTYVLKRECDTAGMTAWTYMLADHTQTGASIAYNFVFSQEYLNEKNCNTCFVNTLYNAFMGRRGEDNEIRYWSSVLRSGSTREDVFNGFVGSQEFTDICNSYGITRGDPNFSGNTHEPSVNVCGTCGGVISHIVQTVPPINEPSGNGDGMILIASYNSELPDMIDAYSPIGYHSVEMVSNDGGAYTTYLDQSFASGDGAPDLFVCDSDFAGRYINSNNTIPVSDLGISGDELGDMYEYALRIGSDANGTVKALAPYICPAFVYYNTEVAAATLGVSEPDQVAPYFATWDAFLSTARTVASAGDGQYRAVHCLGDICRSYYAGRTASVVSDSYFNSLMGNMFDYSSTLYLDGLTWEAPGTDGWFGQWTGSWMADATNHSTLSYWGPMWLGQHSMAFADAESNPTSGEWRIVESPTPWYWGGTYIMASRYCDRNEEVGQILRAITIDQNTLRSMFEVNGVNVNSRTIIRDLANSSAGNVSWLGGQNPYGIIDRIACGINASADEAESADIYYSFYYALDSYVHGNLANADEAEQQFRDELVRYGII